MEEKRNESKGGKIAVGILFLLGAMGLFMVRDQHVWNLFGTVDIPMSFLGGVCAVIGGWKLVSGLMQKKDQ